jgi:rhodanese-related sulfurtransferase
MIWRFFRQDIAWAGMILVLAMSLGEYRHWQLVQAGWQGQLTTLKESQDLSGTGSGQEGLKVELVELAAAWEFFNQKQTLFVDASGRKDYDELHIAGAINLPADEVLGKRDITTLKDVPKDHKIIVYCGSDGCKKSAAVALMLGDLGYTQVKFFPGGFHAWDNAGYPMDTNR